MFLNGIKKNLIFLKESFIYISSEDNFNKVRPYEEILSKELREEILKFHMVLGYKPTLNAYTPRYRVDSVLVNRKHVAIIANWIDRKAENDMHIATIPYKFNLLYRASRDGNTAAAFHGKCDNRGATIVVAKIASSEQIVGGYIRLLMIVSSSHLQIEIISKVQK